MIPSMEWKALVEDGKEKGLRKVNTNFCVNERIYRIALSSLHGLGLFCMDDIKVGYGRCTELMEFVGPCYNYNDWMHLFQ